MPDIEKMPVHVAIIMDGNGRWAAGRKLPRAMGHNAGMKTMKEIVERASDLGIKYLTVYAFSTENWKRTDEEIGGIFKLLVTYVDRELADLDEHNVKVRILGDWHDMPQAVISRLKKTLETTRDNNGLQFNIALNYGSRDEITKSVRYIAEMVKEGRLSPEEIDEETISRNLYTGRYGIPDPELIIRTSGEKRLSNFLLWQAAYSEFLFPVTYWPDFSPDEFDRAISEYQKRDRRFGGRK